MVPVCWMALIRDRLLCGNSFCIIAAIALFAGSLLSTTFLLQFSGIFYVLSLGLMTLLYWFYDPVMFELTHTKRWIRIGSFTLQPSEIMKLAFVLFMVYLTLLYEKDRFSEQSNLTVSTF